jgi:hypothetical protein
MRRSNLTIALLGLLGCGGQEDRTSTSSDAGNQIAPIACEPTSVEAGTVPEGDAEVPLEHRPTPACCPAQRGGPGGQPYPSDYASDEAGGCTSDSQCTSGVNGRCIPNDGEVGPGGCSYDECFTDSNCGSKTPCLCRSSATDNSPNVCDVGGNCAVDSDCGSGGYCSPSVQVLPNQPPDACWGLDLYFCHTVSDLCINDSDCAPPDAGSPPTCAYHPQDSRWECTDAVCALP